jgi:hypothetical protein
VETPAGAARLPVERATESELATTEETCQVDEQRVDEILMRVHAHGISSLSDEERAVLERASQSYQQRRRQRV